MQMHQGPCIPLETQCGVYLYRGYGGDGISQELIDLVKCP